MASWRGERGRGARVRVQRLVAVWLWARDKVFEAARLLAPARDDLLVGGVAEERLRLGAREGRLLQAGGQLGGRADRRRQHEPEREHVPHRLDVVHVAQQLAQRGGDRLDAPRDRDLQWTCRGRVMWTCHVDV